MKIDTDNVQFDSGAIVTVKCSDGNFYKFRKDSHGNWMSIRTGKIVPFDEERVKQLIKNGRAKIIQTHC